MAEQAAVAAPAGDGHQYTFKAKENERATTQTTSMPGKDGHPLRDEKGEIRSFQVAGQSQPCVPELMRLLGEGSLTQEQAAAQYERIVGLAAEARAVKDTESAATLSACAAALKACAFGKTKKS